MFDIGFWELLLIGVVTLLVVGPDRLPEVARTAGKWVLKTRRFVAGVKSDFQSELESGDLHKILGDQREQIKELRSMVDSTRRDIESSTSSAVTAAKKGLASMEASAKFDTDSAKTDTTVSSDGGSDSAAGDASHDGEPQGSVSSSASSPSTTTNSQADTVEAADHTSADTDVTHPSRHD